MLCQHSIPLPSLDKDASSCRVLLRGLPSRRWRAWDWGKARLLGQGQGSTVWENQNVAEARHVSKECYWKQVACIERQPHLQNYRFRKYPWIVLAGKPLTGMLHTDQPAYIEFCHGHSHFHIHHHHHHHHHHHYHHSCGYSYLFIARMPLYLPLAQAQSGLRTLVLREK